MWQTMAQMYKTEGGVFGLYRGIVPTVAGVAPYVSGGGFKTQALLTPIRSDSISWRMNQYGPTLPRLETRIHHGIVSWPQELSLVQ